MALRHTKHLRPDDLPFLNALQRTLVELQHALVLLIGVSFVVEVLADWETSVIGGGRGHRDI